MPLNLAELNRWRYRPIVQWVWDDDPTRHRMCEQLGHIADVGFGGVCIQPMPDNFRPHDFRRRMRIPYLGAAFFDAIREAVTIASDLDLIVWLYDEGGWPSGQACGQVLEGRPELEGQVLVQESGRFLVERTGLTDPLKAEATQRYMALTHERYRDAVGEYFGSTIEAMFSDELKVPGEIGTDRIPWTEDLPERFKNQAGYALEEMLPLLFEGSPARRHPASRVCRVRRDFTRVWIDLFIERCLEPQQRWCSEHGLLFTGHLAGEHDLARHPAMFGDYMAVMRRFDMPGIDTIWRQIWPGHHADFPALAGSARTVHQRRFAMSETGAVYGRDLTCNTLKWLGDHQIMRGINRFTIMNLPLSGDDDANVSALTPNGLHWHAYREWTRHIATFAALASVGWPDVQCGVLYPAEDMAACGGDGPGTAAQAILQELLHLPGGCIYLDEQCLIDAQAPVNGGVLCGDARIGSIVVAGGSLIGEALAQCLPSFKEAGVHLVSVGTDSPYRIDQEGNQTPLRCFQLLDFDNLVETVEAVLNLDRQSLCCLCSDPDLRIVRRSGNDWNLLLLHNESAEPAHVRLNLPEVSLCFDVDTELRPFGEIEPTGVLKIAPGCVVAVASGAIKGIEHLTSTGKWKADTNIDTAWTVVAVEGYPINENAELVHTAPLGSWEPRFGRYFSGEVVYEATVHVADAASELALDLGHVEHVAELRVNGRTIGLRAWPHYRFRLTPHLRPGENQIEIRIANTAANAFWSPQNIVERKAEGRWNVYDDRIVQRCKPQLGGGLFGPIRWLTAKTSEASAIDTPELISSEQPHD